MQLKVINNGFLIKLEKGEEVVKTLSQVSRENNISSGWINGLGAFSSATIGYYELITKSYHWSDFSGDLEVVSLVGNIAILDNGPILHLHICISDEKLNCFGGHLKEGIVGGTLELMIEKIDKEIER